MNAKNLQKATVLLQEIHELDKQIIALDKKAMGIANGDQHVNISLSFETAKPKGPAMEEQDIMESGFGMYRAMLGYRDVSPKNVEKEDHSFKVNETECLFVIGALIQVKKEQRRSLRNQIINLGVTI